MPSRERFEGVERLLCGVVRSLPEALADVEDDAAKVVGFGFESTKNSRERRRMKQQNRVFRPQNAAAGLNLAQSSKKIGECAGATPAADVKIPN